VTAEQRPRAAFIGSVAFSERLLARLAVCESITVAGVATLRAAPSHADFQSLAPTAAQAGLACLELDGNDQERLADWLHGLAVDVAFCIGWPHLLREAVLETPRLGVIGYHPTLLPANRGRHPIIWALALGLDSTGSTFFVMDRGADSGDIVSQREVTIGDDDDAGSLYARLGAVAESQIDEICGELAAGRLPRTPQNPARANAWRRRTRRDGVIDWRMPAAGIRNLVRALTSPYPGATCVVADTEYPVWKVELVAGAPANLEPGRVLAVDGLRVTVKCGDGAVVLADHGIRTPLEAGAAL